VVLFDLQGRKLFQQNVTLNSGIGSFAIPQGIIGSRVALLQVESTGVRMVQKIALH